MFCPSFRKLTDEDFEMRQSAGWLLTSALNLSHRLRIPKVLLCGVDLDNREYLYQNPHFSPDQPYEQRSTELINRSFGGYETTAIIAELLESMAKRGHQIGYVGDSQFLGSLNSVVRIELGPGLDEFIKAQPPQGLA